jgi:hypothetical protein
MVPVFLKVWAIMSTMADQAGVLIDGVPVNRAEVAGRIQELIQAYERETSRRNVAFAASMERHLAAIMQAPDKVPEANGVSKVARKRRVHVKAK